jgi:hypothetical protein
MQTENTTPKRKRSSKVQRADRCLYVTAPSEVETWSLAEQFPGYPNCLGCDEPFTPFNPAFNSYITYADGSHNQGICRRCSTAMALGNDRRDDLSGSPFVASRHWPTLSNAVHRLLLTPD